MSLSMFVPTNFQEQCQEIHEFFLSHNAPLKPKPNENLDVEIGDLVSSCDICFKMSESEAESVLNAFVSILVYRFDNVAECQEFLKRLEAAPTPKFQEIAFNVLNNLFEGLTDECANRIDVYCSLLRVAGKTKSVSEVFQNIDTLKQWLDKSKCTIAKKREVFRVLHQELLNCRLSDMAMKVMVELLSTYSEQDAVEAKADAERCIMATLSDPNIFLMDHLLPLKPIKALEGQPIHNLLKVFIFDKVSTYQEFYQKNKAVVDGLGLDHEKNVEKMRLLTFMMMAEKQREISFDDIRKELGVTDVESFTIRALKTRLVSAKINQMTEKIVVISTMHRTFERSEWQTLKETLQGWHTRLGQVEKSTNHLINNAQYQAANA